MFNLDQAIHDWCLSVHARDQNAEAVDELKDHLYCEIKPLLEQGFTEEEAFHMATERLGEAEDLKAEHSKNRGRISTLFHQTKAILNQHQEKWEAILTPKKLAALNIGVSLIFAAAILVANFFFKDSSYDETITYSLIAVWWIPFSWLTAMTQRANQKAGKSKCG